jgi:ABC-type branched-subunit amino acid transport system ATPase component
VALLEVDKLSAGYGAMMIVHDVSVSADAGQIVTLIGPNGAGKSTLLKAIASELKPQGRVQFKGQDVTGIPRQNLVRKGLGYVPQTRDVFPSLSVDENLEMGGYTLRKEAVRTQRQRVLDRFPQLKPATKRAASTLSGGERKMLGIGRVLMAEPEVMLLDEPGAGLSPEYARVVREHIVELAREGTSILMVEQQAVEALKIADWAYVMVAGRIRHQGPGQDLLNNEDIGAMFLGR